MVFLTCPESISTIPWRYFSKWRLKIFWGDNHPPLTFELWRLTLPPSSGGTPGFFHQNDRKGCKRDVLLRFCAAGDKPSGGGVVTSTLGRTRVNTIQRYIYDRMLCHMKPSTNIDALFRILYNWNASWLKYSCLPNDKFQTTINRTRLLFS